MKILITGKNSFIGRNYIKYSKFKEIDEISLRNTKPEDIDFSKYDVILHLAALVHQKKEIPLDEYIKINSELPFKMAQLAKENGTKHFIFLSTVSVYGAFNNKNGTFNEFSTCTPINNYGISKLQGENQLKKLDDNNFIITILRTPLVYGEGVKANMLSLIKLVDKFKILPLANTKNNRSYIAVENLVEYIDSTIDKKVNGIVVASDPVPISTTELIKLIAKNLNKKLFLFQPPKFIIKIGKKIKPSIFEKIYGSFIVSNEYSLKRLNVANKISTEKAIKKMVYWYLNKKNKKN